MATTKSIRFTFDTAEGKAKTYTFSGTKDNVQTSDIRSAANAFVTNSDAFSIGLTAGKKAEIISTTTSTISL